MIEKILIEINRLKNELDGYSAREALDYIESYINSLPGPQLPSDKLEERLEEINKKGLENAHTIDFSKEYENSMKILQKREQPSEDLEEEVDRYVRERWDMLTSTDSTKSIVRRIARHFAEWQAEKCDEETSKLLYGERQTAYIYGWDDHKQQMLKEAEECELVCIKGRLLAVLPMKEFRWTAGDKVKIVIVPEKEDKK